jgi:hypothetical protein
LDEFRKELGPLIADDLFWYSVEFEDVVLEGSCVPFSGEGGVNENGMYLF